MGADPPDFAMARAVEILANLYQKRAPEAAHFAPLCEHPIVLFDESIALSVGSTIRAGVERTLGIAFSYPARGWHTYAVGGSSRHFLSLFYKETVLAAEEQYVPRSARAPNLAARALLVVALLAYLVAVLWLRPHPTPGPPLRDFEAYYAAGAIWNAGGDPYARDIWNAERSIPGVDSARNELLPFVNPPVLLPALSLYARLPFETAALAWSIMLALILLGCLGALLAIVGRARDPSAWLAIVLIALAFGPISSDLALGQFAIVGVAAVAIASLGLVRSQRLLSSLATFVAGLQPTFAPVLIAWSRNRRNLVVQVAAGAVFLAVWAWLARGGNVPDVRSYLDIVREHGAAEGWTLIQFTPGAIAHGLGASDVLAAALQWGASLIALAAAGSVAWYRRDDPLAVLGAFCALTPLAFPFFHEHDFGLLLIPAFFVLTRANASGRRYALCALLLVGVDWLGIAQRPDGVAQTLLLALALTAAALALTGGARARDFAPLALGLLAIAAVGAIARGHALPIWPDAMGPFSIAQNASVAQVWHAEQLATGMFAPNALSALLRVLPLIGAGLFAWLSGRSPQFVRDSKTPSTGRVVAR